MMSFLSPSTEKLNPLFLLLFLHFIPTVNAQVATGQSDRTQQGSLPAVVKLMLFVCQNWPFWDGLRASEALVSCWDGNLELREFISPRLPASIAARTDPDFSGNNPRHYPCLKMELLQGVHCPDAEQTLPESVRLRPEKASDFYETSSCFVGR
jgi:hypothetical protein